MTRLRPYLRLLLIACFLLGGRASQAQNGQICPYMSVITVAPSTSATNYGPLTPAGTQNNWSVTESQVNYVFGGDASATISGFRVTLQTAPGGTASWTFTIRVSHAGGAFADTTVKVTITGTALSGTSGTTVTTVQPGDLISISSVPSMTPAAPGSIAFGHLMQAGRGQRQYLMSANSINVTVTLAANTTNYGTLNYGSSNASEAQFSEPMPCGGTISNLYVIDDTDPGVASTMTATLRLAGVSQSLTAQVTHANFALPVSDTNSAHAFHANAGQIVGVQIVNSVAAAATRVKWGCTFIPDNDGENIAMGEFGQVQNTTNYSWGHIAGVALGSEATIQVSAPCFFIVRKFYLTTASPPNGQSTTQTLRKNAADTALTVTVAGTGGTTQNSDTADSISIATGDLLSIKIVTTATTANVVNRYGFVCFVPPIVCRRTTNGRIGSRQE